MSEYRKGFRDGWDAARDDTKRGRDIQELYLEQIGPIERYPEAPPKRKRRQSPKQKLLKTMTDAKWKKYKRGSGKKTWVQIRAEVSRSQIYKKKARRLK